MASTPRKVPAYRLHKPTGQAVVRLDGKDHYLGKHGTSESSEKYNRVVAEWLNSGSILRNRRIAEDQPSSVLTVAEVMLAFWKHSQQHYRAGDGTPSEELGNIKAALKPVRLLYGMTLAKDFGPLSLRAVRERMIADGLMRTTINARINRVRRAFKWAASVELVPVAVVQALATVNGLQRGRTQAREPEAVGPVPVADVAKTLPFLTRPVAGMVRLQLLTGMRPGEVCVMRGCDLKRGESTWIYRPASHKTAWRGKVREIVIGPQAQELIASFGKLDLTAYLFDPREAVAEYHASRSSCRKSKPTPLERSRRKAKPGENHSVKYNRNSYRNAVRHACERAGVEPWSPNQLRHAAATAIRAQFGLEAAQSVLGHAKADVTQVYAERDLAKARDVMSQIG